MGDVEDPDIYAAQPLYEFMQTNKGQWIKENCADPQYSIVADPMTYGYRITVYGALNERQQTEYFLRW